MGRRRRELPKLESVEIIDMGSEGKAIAKLDGKVVFVPFAAPGDVVDIQVVKKKKAYLEGKVTHTHKLSEMRIEPECEHFGVCGGCKWQHIPYEAQLAVKEKHVKDNLERIAKVELNGFHPILGNEERFFYRNKLEFTFSNFAWLTDFSKDVDFGERNMNALGFHVPGMFDRVLNINKCHLQAEPSNAIRMAVKGYADEHELTYFDIKRHHGLLRNIVIRSSSTGELMVIVVFYEDIEEARLGLMNFLQEKFPEISSLMYIINQKANDSIGDQDVISFSGKDHLMEEMEGIHFKVGPKSFYQTNSPQAYNLYKIAREYAKLTGEEKVYDLYTGTGTIANFVAKNAKEVIGIEYVEEAIEDAKVNSELNHIDNTKFFAGDMVDVLSAEFIAEHGTPDVIITDPPRAGMHPKVVQRMMESGAKRIVYISCNPGTQARDMELLKEKYTIEAIQPVDMFPQTHHVENVISMVLTS